MHQGKRNGKDIGYSVGKRRGLQNEFQTRGMRIAKICLADDPAEAVFELLAVADLVIQTIPQREVRERLIKEVLRAFAASLESFHGRGPIQKRG